MWRMSSATLENGFPRIVQTCPKYRWILSADERLYSSSHFRSVKSTPFMFRDERSDLQAAILPGSRRSSSFSLSSTLTVFRVKTNLSGTRTLY